MTSRSKGKQPFWLGGAAASIAVCFTHPLDQTKYRMQVLKSRDPMLATLLKFARRDGILSLWDGLSASVFRQATYSTARFGLYNIFSAKLRQYSGNSQPSTTATIACAGLAGGLAGVVGNPTEVVLVRMCADGAKPAAERFSYSDPFSALYRIAREEGVRVFGRGLTANMARSVLMNVSQIAPYAAAKRVILEKTSLKDDVRTHALASLFAGTVATTLCAPADVLKSRMQSSAGALGGLVQVIRDGMRNEGPRFLMKGWTPAWLRLTPHTILTFVFMEKLEQVVQFSATSRATAKTTL